MFINSLRIGFAGLMISAVAAWAAPVGPATLQGDVKDSKGQSVAGAEVHIQAKDGSNLQKIVRTDANGHYVWIPSQTGSHLGVWMEVNDDAKDMPSGMAERLRWQGNALARQIQNSGRQTASDH